MKQSTKQSNSALFYKFDEQEIEVSNILLNLGTLIHQSEACSKLPFTWGSKKRRSNKDAIVAGPSSHHHHHHHHDVAAATTTSAPSLPINTTTTFQSDDDGIDTKVHRNLQNKVEASSPATPLSFSPSESDDNKSKHSSLKKSFKKRSREEWLEIIEGLTQSREVLRGEVENVRSYYNKLKAFNMELKAMKHERLTAYVRQQLPHMEINKAMNLGMNLSQHYRISIMPHQQHQQNYVVDQEFQYPYGHVMPLFSSSNGGNGLGMVNHVGPLGIPDLNISAEEAFGMDSSQPLDHGQTLEERKAMAAEKRMIRRMINIKKKSELRSR